MHQSVKFSSCHVMKLQQSCWNDERSWNSFETIQTFDLREASNISWLYLYGFIKRYRLAESLVWVKVKWRPRIVLQLLAFMCSDCPLRDDCIVWPPHPPHTHDQIWWLSLPQARLHCMASPSTPHTYDQIWWLSHPPQIVLKWDLLLKKELSKLGIKWI